MEFAFRMWVRRSAIGSVMLTGRFLLSPARLADPGDLPLGSQRPETDAAHLKLAVVAPPPPAELTPIVPLSRELGRPQLLDLPGRLRHGASYLLNGTPNRPRRARDSSSEEFLMVMAMFNPWTNSTSSMLISGKTICSERPSE